MNHQKQKNEEVNDQTHKKTEADNICDRRGDDSPWEVKFSNMANH